MGVAVRSAATYPRTNESGKKAKDICFKGAKTFIHSMS